MIQTRLPHSQATPARTGGDDRPRGACYGLAERMAPDPTPFDVLTDHTAGPAFEAARREARDLCGVRADGLFRAPEDRCPLAATCLMRDNTEEPWARAVMGAGAAAKPKPRTSENYHAARNAARAADLAHLIADGTSVDEAAERLGVSRKGLERWCRHHDREAWERLVMNGRRVAA